MSGCLGAESLTVPCNRSVQNACNRAHGEKVQGISKTVNTHHVFVIVFSTWSVLKFTFLVWCVVLGGFKLCIAQGSHQQINKSFVLIILNRTAQVLEFLHLPLVRGRASPHRCKCSAERNCTSAGRTRIDSAWAEEQV